MKNKSRLLQIGLLAGLLSLSLSAAASPYGFRPRQLSAYLEGSLLNTSKNLDNSGSVVGLPGDGKFSEQKYILDISYDISKKWGVFSNFTFKRTTSQDGRVDRVSSGPGDLLLGSDYQVYSGFVNVIPELSFSFPIHSVSDTTDDVLLGDGATTLTPRVNVSRNFVWLSAYTYVGYRMRGRGLSSLMPYGLMLHKETSSFFIEGGLNGASSLSEDSSPTSSREAINGRVDAGSQIYNSRKPSWLNAVGRVGWRLEPDLYVNAGIEQTINGANTFYGTRFLIGIGYTDAFGEGRKKLGQSHGNSYFTGEIKPEDDSAEVESKKKFKVQPRQEELQTPEVETFDVEIKRARPTKKYSPPPKTKPR